jgi:hypothetical protein
MHSSAETAREAIVRTLIALERSCLDADAALVERRWADVEAAFGAQVSMTDELAALFAVAPETSPQLDAKVAQRIDGILKYRDDQLRRLRSYNAEVASRLDAIGRVNALSRSIGQRNNSGQVLDGQY